MIGATAADFLIERAHRPHGACQRAAWTFLAVIVIEQVLR